MARTHAIPLQKLSHATAKFAVQKPPRGSKASRSTGVKRASSGLLSAPGSAEGYRKRRGRKACLLILRGFFPSTNWKKKKKSRSYFSAERSTQHQKHRTVSWLCRQQTLTSETSSLTKHFHFSKAFSFHGATRCTFPLQCQLFTPCSEETGSSQLPHTLNSSKAPHPSVLHCNRRAAVPARRNNYPIFNRDLHFLHIALVRREA